MPTSGIRFTEWVWIIKSMQWRNNCLNGSSIEFAPSFVLESKRTVARIDGNRRGRDGVHGVQFLCMNDTRKTSSPSACSVVSTGWAAVWMLLVGPAWQGVVHFFFCSSLFLFLFLLFELTLVFNSISNDFRKLRIHTFWKTCFDFWYFYNLKQNNEIQNIHIDKYGTFMPKINIGFRVLF